MGQGCSGVHVLGLTDQGQMQWMWVPSFDVGRCCSPTIFTGAQESANRHSFRSQLWSQFRAQERKKRCVRNAKLVAPSLSSHNVLFEDLKQQVEHDWDLAPLQKVTGEIDDESTEEWEHFDLEDWGRSMDFPSLPTTSALKEIDNTVETEENSDEWEHFCLEDWERRMRIREVDCTRKAQPTSMSSKDTSGRNLEFNVLQHCSPSRTSSEIDLMQTFGTTDGDVQVSETDTGSTAEVGKKFAGASVDPCASDGETEEGVSEPSDWEADSAYTGASSSVFPSLSSNQVSGCSWVDMAKKKTMKIHAVRGTDVAAVTPSTARFQDRKHATKQTQVGKQDSRRYTSKALAPSQRMSVPRSQPQPSKVAKSFALKSVEARFASAAQMCKPTDEQQPVEQVTSPLRNSQAESEVPVAVVEPGMNSRSTSSAIAMKGLSKDGSPRYAGEVTWSRGSMAWLQCAALTKQFDRQVFLHKKQCKNGSMPRQGDRVTFTLVVTDDGRPQAQQVQQVEPEVKPSKLAQPQAIDARDWFAARFQKQVKS